MEIIIVYLQNKLTSARGYKLTSVQQNKRTGVYLAVKTSKANDRHKDTKKIMATIQEKLAESLKVLQDLQNENGFAIVKSSEITRVHLERLVSNGFLQEVMKGWYISSRPDNAPGDTTNWYTTYWYFISKYCNSRFGKDWCLTPDHSLSIYSGNWIVPAQVIIRSPKGANNITGLMYETSLLDIRTSLANPVYTESRFGLNLYTFPEALIESSPDFFRLDSITARTCLVLIPDASDVLKILLEKGQTTKAGRLAGAFRNIGHTAVADEIVGTMKSLGYDIREEDPFEDKITISYSRVTSPYAARLKLMWSNMREVVKANFPETDNVHADIEACMRDIDAQYELDAYHSLSIEGYRVTDALIEKVKSGNWQPDANTSDAEQKNAMAARGYYQAFEAVKDSIRRILEDRNAGEVTDNDHRIWYRELFAPSVEAGILKPACLAGYRTAQVYIRGSLHTPLSPEAVRDAMPVLFDLLKEEPDARVRAILGHFLVVYIHPYMDGNGRMGRFLMNTMLISGGYNWTIVPIERRQEYMKAIEKGSVEGDITDFTLFIASLLK